jgi:hypothetical protein
MILDRNSGLVAIVPALLLWPLVAGAGCRALSQEIEDEEAAEELPAPALLEVSNFVSGPVCRDGDLIEERREEGRPPSDRICEGTDVRVSGKDACIWSGEKRRCTWWGFEFDFESADPDEPITCVWTRSAPVDDGNYEGIRQSDVVADTIAIELESTSGHHFFPGYDLYPDPSPTWYVIDLTYDCVYRDVPIFRPEYRLIFSSVFR